MYAFLSVILKVSFKRPFQFCRYLRGVVAQYRRTCRDLVNFVAIYLHFRRYLPACCFCRYLRGFLSFSMFFIAIYRCIERFRAVRMHFYVYSERPREEAVLDFVAICVGF